MPITRIRTRTIRFGPAFGACHIPIIAIVDDMVAAGVVPSLARPGGNITGVSILAPERLDILIELAPNARRIAALADPNSTASPRLQALRDAAQEGWSS